MGKKKKGKGEKVQPPPKPHESLWPLVAVIIFAGVINLGTVGYGFIWDDHNLVERKAQGHTFRDFVKLWTSDFWQTDRVTNKSEYYRPLTTTTFFLDSALYDNQPAGYHFTNVILYALTCGLVYLLYRRLFGSMLTALLLALAFAAMPAHTENVAWISGRTDIVCAAFMFASLLIYLRADETGRPREFAIATALFFLSLFGKEMSITLVAVVFLHQWLFHGLSRSSLMRVAPFAGAAAVFMIIHSVAVPPSPSENIYLTPLAYAGNFLRNLAYSAWYSVWPGGFEYLVTATREQAARTFTLPTGFRLALTIIFLVALLGLSALAYWKKQRLLALGLASGLLAIVPTSGLLPIGVIFAIRFLLIPSFFFLLAVGAALVLLSERVTWLTKLPVPAAVLVLGPVILVYTVITEVRLPDWRDDATLMESVLAKVPDSALGHFIMGNALAERGREAEAIPHFERAISLRPEYPEALYNLGVLEERAGNQAAAEKRYRAVLTQKPDYRPARGALARLLQASGRSEEARRLINEDPQLKPR